MGSPRFPEPPSSIPDTDFGKADALVARLQKRKDDWAKLGIPARIKYLDKLQAGVQQFAEGWVDASLKAKGFHKDSGLAGEEWLSGPMTVARNIRLLKEALQKNAQPKPLKVEEKFGQTVCTVFPSSTVEKLMFAGLEGKVWIEPGKPASQGRIYRENQTEGKVCLTLGAGNISSIGPMDVLYKMFIENELCVLKMNPVNDYVGPHIEKAFKCLVDDDFFGVVYGGAEIGKYLTNHDGIDTIHITGSAATHDAIIWGVGDDQQKNKDAGTPICEKPISSELGAVTPLIVTPGPWTDAQIAYHATQAASMIAHNASFDCNAVKVVVTAKGWPLLDKWKKALRKSLAEAEARKAYYPGAQDRYQKFLDAYPEHEVVGETGEEIVPWTVIPNVSPDSADEYALSHEAFCGVVAEVELDVTDAADFLPKAVEFANEKCWGTLSCSILVHPETERAHGALVDEAIRDLRYGGIAFNLWPGLLYGAVTTTWGAFPGHPLEDVRSGRGVVHNTFMFDHPQKSVVKGPFVMKPKPVWFHDHKRLPQMGQKLLRYEANPSLLTLPGIVSEAIRG